MLYFSHSTQTLSSCEAFLWFELWRSKTPDGFVISCSTWSEMVVHRALCQELNYLNSRKEQTWPALHVCSIDIERLKNWASDHKGIELQSCRHCQPVNKLSAQASATKNTC
jgi:hypothetical protein